MRFRSRTAENATNGKSVSSGIIHRAMAALAFVRVEAKKYLKHLLRQGLTRFLIFYVSASFSPVVKFLCRNKEDADAKIREPKCRIELD